MLKVLHVVRLAEGGMQKHVLSLIERVDPERFSFALTASPDFAQSSKIDIEFFSAEIGDDLKPSSLALAVRIASFARKSGVAIIHAHGYKAAVVGALASVFARKPFVFTAHNLFPVNALKQAKMALRFCASRAVKVIAVSTGCAGSLTAAGIDRSKISVIPNGIELEYYDSPVDREAVRLRIGVNAGEKVVACVARLTRVKGVNILIEAAPAILREVPEAKVVIVGSGPDQHALGMLAEVIEPKGSVVMLGYREDAREILGAADVVAVPSIEEGQSIVTLEAMAWSRPVVASAVGGLTDSIEDGVTGLLVPCGNAERLAESVVRLLKDPELSLTLGIAARAKVQSEFTVEKMIQRTQELYSCVAR